MFRLIGRFATFGQSSLLCTGNFTTLNWFLKKAVRETESILYAEKASIHTQPYLLYVLSLLSTAHAIWNIMHYKWIGKRTILIVSRTGTLNIILASCVNSLPKQHLHNQYNQNTMRSTTLNSIVTLAIVSKSLANISPAPKLHIVSEHIECKEGVIDVLSPDKTLVVMNHDIVNEKCSTSQISKHCSV